MKKQFLILILAFLSGVIPARGEVARPEVPAIFREANSLYERGDYAGAAKGYLSIVEGGWESAPVYYNLGNACFKQNRLGPAILYYCKAQNLDPRDPEINKNLEYARESLRDDITSHPLPLWSRAGRSVASWFSLAGWIWISAVLYCLAFLWLLAVLLIRPLKKISPAVLKTLLPALALAVALSLLAFSHYRTPRAIVLEAEVQVRYGPQETDAAAFQLHEGTEVRVVRKRNGWLQIALPDGTSGWLPADVLGRI